MKGDGGCVMTTKQQFRRSFLKLGPGLALSGIGGALTAPVHASIGSANKKLSLDHTHTREQIGLVYAVGDEYLPPSLNRLNVFLRDHYSGDVGRMDPRLYDILYQIRRELGTQTSFQIISGYRSPNTNERLRTTRGGGVAKRSLHMDGKALDIRLPGVPLSELRDAALSLRQGGVGYYPKDQFVHIDTGKPRSW